MRCADRIVVLATSVLFVAPGASGTLSLLHQQRYAMGTMFDVVVYHPSRLEAQRAVSAALHEITRLDNVMSNFKPDSELSKLARSGRGDFVTVDRDLYKVIEASLVFSRRSHGAFDITVGPLVRVWRQAREENRLPSSDAIAAARRCVGYERIELEAPDRIRLKSDCVELDLGAIGKGYAVDRAIEALAAAGIRHAVVNAGRSSIAAMGHPPDSTGWPVTLATGSVRRLRNESISTAQQSGDIFDPRLGAPAPATTSVSVVAPSAMVSDALDTTLLLMSIGEGRQLLSRYSNVSAFWIAENGELTAVHRAETPATARRR
jgi:thiamine biosynthesis lipoprotein